MLKILKQCVRPEPEQVEDTSAAEWWLLHAER